jgi:hypothetical protein
VMTIRDICTGPVYRWKKEGILVLEIRARIIKLAQENGVPRCDVNGTDDAFDLIFEGHGVISFSDGNWGWKPKQV